MLPKIALTTGQKQDKNRTKTGQKVASGDLESNAGRFCVVIILFKWLK
jgi:hypothetical protein